MPENAKPWDIINGSQKVSEKIIKQRLEICYACPAFKPLTQRCKKCGCFMKLKTQIEKAYCPLGKW